MPQSRPHAENDISDALIGENHEAPHRPIPVLALPISKCFHVKDAEFKPDGRTGVYGGYQSWQNRAGRFRSTGDGDVDFVGIFTLLAKYGYQGWATIEWECCFKDSQQGAEEGAPFIQSHLITPPAKAFDDFAGGDVDQAAVRKALGLE